jgi:hypothetical protein
VFTGAGGNTLPLADDDAVVLPPVFVAVTTARRVCPTSPSTGVYVEDVAPLMFVHDSPALLQSSH